MESFQKTVLVIATIILIISLILIGMAFNYAKNKNWPPSVPKCPDYWIADGSGNDATCINMKDLGTCPASNGTKHLVMNFNKAPYNGTDELCAKYTWAKNCSLAWDGITYGVENPCVTNATT